MGELEEGDLIEVLLQDSSYNVFKQDDIIVVNVLSGFHAFQNQVDFVDSQMLELDFGVVGLEQLVDSLCEESCLLCSETAVFLVEVSESAQTGFLL